MERIEAQQFSKKRDIKAINFKNVNFQENLSKIALKTSTISETKPTLKKQLKNYSPQITKHFQLSSNEFYFYHSIPILTQFLNKHLKSINTRSNLCIQNRFFPTKITYKNSPNFLPKKTTNFLPIFGRCVHTFSSFLFHAQNSIFVCCLLNFAADFLRFKVQLSSSAGQALRRVSALWHVRAGELAELRRHASLPNQPMYTVALLS